MQTSLSGSHGERPGEDKRMDKEMKNGIRDRND